MRRLPIRLQVTLAFAAALALVLLAAGAFVYLRFEEELERTVDSGLRSRAAEVTALRASGSTLATARSAALVEDEESFAVVLDARGRELDATPGAPDVQLDRDELSGRGPRFLDREHGAADGEPARLLAVSAGDEVVVVGQALDDQREALAALLTLGGLGLAAALLLGSAAGYLVAGIALRPVEAMRAEAEAITDTPDRRLPVPPVADEIGRLGATLNAMLDRIEAAFARERTFVADASHELRTPLAILKTELELALGRGRTNEELTAALRSAAEETDRLVALAEDLLVIARSDQGQLPIRPRELRAAELLERVRDRRAPGATIEPGADGLVVRGDPLRLEQALGNLLDNALRYGGAAIELAAEDRNGVVRLHVRDDGPGLPDDLEAFERFTRGDSARSRGGAGLGLAIVAAIARAHGGGAGAAARPGGGADVWIELPGQSS